MKRLILAFAALLALSQTAFAVGETKGLGNIYGSSVGLSPVGDGSGLSVLTSGTTVSYTLQDIPSSPINVLQFGAICDGAPHAQNLTAVHLAAAMASSNPMKTVIDLPDNCVWGTNTTTGVETPIALQNNTLLRIFGRQFHNVNNASTQGLIVASGGYSDADTVSTSNVIVQGMPGNVLDTVSRTLLSESRKMIVLGNCNNCQVNDVRVSTSTFLGSFTMQGRNPTNISFNRNQIRLFPSTAGLSGGDGIHLTGNVNGALISGNDVQSIDDCISVTEENSTMSNKAAKGVRVVHNKCATYAFSGLKLFTGNNAVNSSISDMIVDDNQFAIWGPTRVDGNCIKVQQEDGRISNIRMGLNTCDASNGNGVAVLFTAVNPCGVDNVDMGQLTVANYQGRGVEIDGNVCGLYSTGGAHIGPWTGATTVITATTVSAMVRSAANTGTAYLSSSTDLSSVATDGSNFLQTTGMNLGYNNSIFAITAKNVSTSTVSYTATGISTSTDETGASGTGAIINRGTGSAIYDRGSYNTRLENMVINSPATFGYMYTTYNGNTYASTTVPSIAYFGENTAKLTISTTTTLLGEESPYSGYLTTTSFTTPINNVTNAKIVSVSLAGKYMLINIPGYTSSTAETNTSATVTTTYLPTDSVLRGTSIISQTAGTGISLQAGMGVTLDKNRCINFAGGICGSETSSASVSGSVITNNQDLGLNRRTRQSWSFSDGQEAQRYGNEGTNPDKYDAYPFNLVSASTLTATSATLTTSLTVGNVSLTTGLLKTLNVSTTGGISATGNISANAFIGDGSGLANVVASVTPGGASSTIQFNANGTTTSGTSGMSWSPSQTLLVNSGDIQGSHVQGTTAGTCSTNALQVAAANNGLSRPASNNLSVCAGGTEGWRLTTSVVSTSLNLNVAGGNVSLTTGYIHLGSPTTVPTCDATNKGNTFMNTTTNCLNYCDGTANRQVTSVAGSCS